MTAVKKVPLIILQYSEFTCEHYFIEWYCIWIRNPLKAQNNKACKMINVSTRLQNPHSVTDRDTYTHLVLITDSCFIVWHFATASKYILQICNERPPCQNESLRIKGRKLKSVNAIFVFRIQLKTKSWKRWKRFRFSILLRQVNWKAEWPESVTDSKSSGPARIIDLVVTCLTWVISYFLVESVPIK